MRKYIQHSPLVIIACLVPLLFIGCASGVTRPTTAPVSAQKLAEERKVAEVSISLTPEAKEKFKDNLKFDHEALRKQVEKALDGSSLFDASKKGQLPTIEIVVTSMRVRSNFSAVMWGVFGVSPWI